jgi:ADP-ribose pyrophosphatase YjhB (NUDIX family)
MDNTYKWLELARQLQSIAQAGLSYTENSYDVERYEQLMEISRDLVADFTGKETDFLNDLFFKEKGYFTPKVDIRAVVMRDDAILMVKEKNDGKWSLPGGWADVGYSPAEVAEKEVLEESGIEAKAERLLAVFDKKKHPHPEEFHYVYKMFFLCRESGGTFKPNTETSDMGFFKPDELPPLSEGRNTLSQIRLMFDLSKKIKMTLFD